jgi:transcriptional regulator with XRE-family HTH domain
VAAKKKDGRETSEIEKEEAQLTRVIISVLRAARDDSDVTQEELGRRMGWSKKQMWDLEHGRKTVTVAHFFMIARRLGIDPERLVRRVKNY